MTRAAGQSGQRYELHISSFAGLVPGATHYRGGWGHRIALCPAAVETKAGAQ